MIKSIAIWGCGIVLCLLSVAANQLHAGWPEDGVAICQNPDYQSNPKIVPDGCGGAIIVWEDHRGATSIWDIYAQRVNADGLVLWTIDGIPICAEAGYQQEPQIIPYEGGGAIVTWKDSRDFRDLPTQDVYIQRIDLNGSAIWQPGGVPVIAVGWTEDPQLVSDGLGGAIVTWMDYRYQDFDIFAQRIDSSGNMLWNSLGLPVCTASGTQDGQRMIADNNGGAIIVWQDYRHGSGQNWEWDIYAQRVNRDGNMLWASDGVPVCTAVGQQTNLAVAWAGSDYAIVTWQDKRGGGYDVYAQRIDFFGNVVWTADGIAVCSASGDQTNPQIVSDGAGGAIIAWMDQRSGEWDVYAQRIDANGAGMWMPQGIAICAAPGNQSGPQIISNASGGAIIAWDDARNGNAEIYAQNVTGSATPLWPYNGAKVSAAANNQGQPVMAPDGMKGAIVAWEDYRTGTPDIYAMRVSNDFGPVATELKSFSANFHESRVVVSWELMNPGASVVFRVFRAEGTTEEFAEISSPEIHQNGSAFVFEDTKCRSGFQYTYRIVASDERGERLLFETEKITVPEIPVTLYQNVPNPFNPSTTITYYLREQCHAKLEIYDMSGRCVARLMDGEQPQGPYTVEWNGHDSRGNLAASGIYVYKLTAGKEKISRKMVLLR